MEFPDQTSNAEAWDSHKYHLTSKPLIFFKGVKVSVSYTINVSVGFFQAAADAQNKNMYITCNKYACAVFVCFLQVNNSIHVNSVDVPDSDLMATNGVIHVVKNILYPAGEKTLSYYTFILLCAVCTGMHYALLMMYITYRPSCGPPGPPGPPEETDQVHPDKGKGRLRVCIH